MFENLLVVGENRENCQRKMRGGERRFVKRQNRRKSVVGEWARKRIIAGRQIQQ